jgi:hypothetical protein
VRTKAGLASARTKGRVGGNPGLRGRDPAALRNVRLALQDGYMDRLKETAQDWVPHVRRLRPDLAWEVVPRIINAPCPASSIGRKAAFRARSTPMAGTASYRPRYRTAPAAAKPTTACPPSSPPSRARTPKSRFTRSAPDWK